MDAGRRKDVGRTALIALDSVILIEQERHTGIV
jgi:hypothetical protein